MLRTIGISPKAWMPTVAGLLVGVALLVVGYLAKDAVLEGVGWAIVASGLGHFGIAVAAPPGLVINRSVEQAAGKFFADPSVSSGEQAAVAAGEDVVRSDTRMGLGLIPHNAPAQTPPPAPAPAQPAQPAPVATQPSQPPAPPAA